MLPLGLQQLGLVMGALVVAQLVTLILTLLLPPAPAPRWNLEKVADTLLGKIDDALLDRQVMTGPPDLDAPGWLISESSRAALAERLGLPVSDVVLAFYTQLPVGGVAVPVDAVRLQLGWRRDGLGSVAAALGKGFVAPAYAQTGPGGSSSGGRSGGLGASGPSPHGNDNPRPPDNGGPLDHDLVDDSQPAQGAPAAAAPRGSRTSVQNTDEPRAGTGRPAVVPRRIDVRPQTAAPAATQSGTALQADRPAPRPQQSDATTKAPAAPGDGGPSGPARGQRDRAATTTSSGGGPVALPTAAPQARAAPAPAPPTTEPAPSPTRDVQPRVIPFRAQTGLAGLAAPPFIEGDFIAAMRIEDGSWVAVAPRPEPFPNRWQQRVMLWFVLSLMIVAPLVWFFTRRIVKPLEGFALAAETLGRDPAASVLPLYGPAEIGRAANAFNQMRARLQAFVEDRTAVVGAISHDLRTPLTRLRFRLEDVPEDQRDAMLRDVEEMEAMIAEVIGFMRDATNPGARQRVDLAALVAGAVHDARLMGADVAFDLTASIPVEADPLSMRRLLANLLENAIKYGERARVRLRVEGDTAVTEVIDDGPGIPADERERAFEPFFRGENARESDKPGSGLGLAVCRSIARAHGGDVLLEQRAEGFVVSLALPTLYGAGFPRAA